MSDYENLWEYTQKCEAHIKQLEAELARVNGEAKEQEVELLKWAYCEAVGADSIVGLDCCDNYKDWLIGLSRLRQGE